MLLKRFFFLCYLSKIGGKEYRKYTCGSLNEEVFKKRLIIMANSAKAKVSVAVLKNCCSLVINPLHVLYEHQDTLIYQTIKTKERKEKKAYTVFQSYIQSMFF